MKVIRVKAGNDELLQPDAAFWGRVVTEKVTLVPVPVVMVQELSPFLAISQNHGVISEVQVEMVHNGEMLAVRLNWAAEKQDRIRDLDGFVNGVAVMFPTVAGALAATMGAQGKPVNAWYWKADQKLPYEVLAEGFRFVQRQKDNAGSDLAGTAVDRDGRWQVVFRRSLGARNGLVRFKPGGFSGIAFAAWSGANAERSGCKSFSGEFEKLDFAV